MCKMSSRMSKTFCTSLFCPALTKWKLSHVIWTTASHQHCKNKDSVMSLSAAHLCVIHTFCASLVFRFTRVLHTGAHPCSRVQCHLLSAARRRLAINQTFASLVELIAGSINNDALHAANSAQNSDDDSSEDTEPGCPEVPAAWARLLDGQPEHGGKAVGRGTKAQSTNEPQQVSKERDCHSCMHSRQSHD